MITVFPNPVNPNGSSWVTFRGPPNTRVTWELTGDATLSQVDNFTDERGIASAILTATEDQSVTIKVSYGS